MEGILELEKQQPVRVVANPGIKPMGKVESEKLRKANETLEKYPIPAWIFLSRYSKAQQQEGISISGVLKSADVESSTLVVTVIINEYAQSNYHIRTTPELLNKVVKTYWNEAINVRIRPQINKDNEFEYELVAIEVVK
jgi:hypothetical protein